MNAPNRIGEATEAATVTRIHGRRELEQSFLEAFQRMGGVERLTEWGRTDANFPEFLRLLVKFAPKNEVQEQSGLVLEYRSLVPSSPLNRPPPEPVTRMTLLRDAEAEDAEFSEGGE